MYVATMTNGDLWAVPDSTAEQMFECEEEVLTIEYPKGTLIGVILPCGVKLEPMEPIRL